MPNSGNRSTSPKNAGQGQSKIRTEKDHSQKVNLERSDKKRGDRGHDERNGDTGRTSSQGRKAASGGS